MNSKLKIVGVGIVFAYFAKSLGQYLKENEILVKSDTSRMVVHAVAIALMALIAYFAVSFKGALAASLVAIVLINVAPQTFGTGAAA